MKAIEALTALELLGSDQWNLFTAKQALKAGVSRNRLTRFAEAGTITRVRSGVYALPSADHGPLQELRAAWLSTNPRIESGSQTRPINPVVVSGVSAAQVHGIGDLIPARHEFTSPARRQTSQPDIHFRRGHLSPDEWEIVEGLPVTNAVRTVADVARSHADYDHLSGTVREALEKPGVSASALAQALAPFAKRYGKGSGEALFRDMVSSSPTDSKVTDLVRTFLTPELRAAIRKASAADLSKAFPSSGFLQSLHERSAEIGRILAQDLANSQRASAAGLSKIVSGIAESQAKSIDVKALSTHSFSQQAEHLAHLLALSQAHDSPNPQRKEP